MSKLGSNFLILRNTEMERRNNWTIKFRRLNQCEIPIHCHEFVLKFIWINFRLFCFELKLFITEGYPALFTIIMNELFYIRHFCMKEGEGATLWYTRWRVVSEWSDRRINKLFYNRYFCIKEGEKGRYFLIH